MCLRLSQITVLENFRLLPDEHPTSYRIVSKALDCLSPKRIGADSGRVTLTASRFSTKGFDARVIITCMACARVASFVNIEWRAQR